MATMDDHKKCSRAHRTKVRIIRKNHPSSRDTFRPWVTSSHIVDVYLAETKFLVDVENALRYQASKAFRIQKMFVYDQGTFTI